MQAPRLQVSKQQAPLTPLSDALVIARIAFATRIFTVILGLLSNDLAGVYDSSMTIFQSQEIANATKPSPVSPFAHWDGIHLISIAEHGYLVSCELEIILDLLKTHHQHRHHLHHSIPPLIFPFVYPPS